MSLVFHSLIQYLKPFQVNESKNHQKTKITTPPPKKKQRAKNLTSKFEKKHLQTDFYESSSFWQLKEITFIYYCGGVGDEIQGFEYVGEFFASELHSQTKKPYS